MIYGPELNQKHEREYEAFWGTLLNHTRIDSVLWKLWGNVRSNLFTYRKMAEHNLALAFFGAVNRPVNTPPSLDGKKWKIADYKIAYESESYSVHDKNWRLSCMIAKEALGLPIAQIYANVSQDNGDICYVIYMELAPSLQ